MTLGQKLKQLRLAKEMSQPELALAVGIEQSYLSKLENDKAFPSDEIFNQLLQAFELEPEEFLEGFEHSTIQNQLSKLAVVNRHQQQFERKSVSYMIRWLAVSALLIALGGTALIAGEKHWIFQPAYSTTHFYESKGVVKGSESLRIFEVDKEDMSDELLARVDFQQIDTRQPSGEYFVKPVDGGQRFFKRARRQMNGFSSTENNWLRVFGVLALLSGIIGLVIEHKVRRLRTVVC